MVKVVAKTKKVKKEVKNKKTTTSKVAHIKVEPKEPKEPLKPEVLKEPQKVKITAEGTGDEKVAKKEKYFEAVGRRKESVAITRLYTKKSTDTIEGDYALLIVNGKDYRNYFTDKTLQAVVESPLRKLKSLNRFKATVLVKGGGIAGQAGAVKHGLSRTLILFDLNFRKKLKKSGFLTRDPRVKERRKYGLKKARKAPGWSKR